MQTTLHVQGMTCGHCTGRVDKALRAVAGVTDATVALPHTATVTHDASVSRDVLEAAVTDAGYELGDGDEDDPEQLGGRVDTAPDHAAVPDQPTIRISVPVHGMHCASCVSSVENELTALPGVDSAYVNLASGRATVTGTTIAEPDVRKAIERVGYRSPIAQAGETELDVEARDRAQEVEYLSRRLKLALPLSAAVMLLAMGPMWLGWPEIPTRLNHTLQMVLTLPVQFWAGSRFVNGMLRSMWSWRADMNTLIGLGTLVAFVWSCLGVFYPPLISFEGAHPQVFFETAAVIITLVLFGNLLEARAKGQTGQSIRALLAMAPKQATVLTDAGELVVDVADVVPGDLLLVRPGQTVPTDGVVLLRAGLQRPNREGVAVIPRAG